MKGIYLSILMQGYCTLCVATTEPFAIHDEGAEQPLPPPDSYQAHLHKNINLLFDFYPNVGLQEFLVAEQNH